MSSTKSSDSKRSRLPRFLIKSAVFVAGLGLCGALLGALLWRDSEVAAGSRAAIRLLRAIVAVGLVAIAATWIIVRPSWLAMVFALVLAGFYLVIWRGGWQPAPCR